MSMMKHWLEGLSVEMGFGGEINDAVIEAAEKRMSATPPVCETPGCLVNHHPSETAKGRTTAGIDDEG